MTDTLYKKAKSLGYPDAAIRRISGKETLPALAASYKMVDTCGAEFDAETPYFYATYDSVCEAREFIKNRKKETILVLGSGPIRIGQGIEFDYSSVHCVMTLKKLGYDVVIVNNNPETVSTDYDTTDRLYFEPLTPEDVMNVIRVENPVGVVVAFGGQTAIRLTEFLHRKGIPILGTSITAYSVALNLPDFNGTVGGNISGTSDLAPLSDQAQMILDFFPEAKKVGLFYCSAEPNSAYQVAVVKEYLEAKGITCIEYKFSDSNDVAQVAEKAASDCDVIYIPTDNTAASCTETINNIVLPKKVPIIAGEEGICSGCGVATLSISYYEIGYKTGEMAAEILRGEANISEMAIAYDPNPVKKYNKEICEELGITVPEGYKAIGE